jgi:hypothetical protein
MSELEELFEEADSQQPVIAEAEEEKSYDHGEKILKSLEQEYKGELNTNEQRKNEKLALEKELKETLKKLKNAKNVKNHRKTEINAKISARRKLYKQRITELKDKLYNIDLEEKGSEIASSDLVDTTIKENSNNF